MNSLAISREVALSMSLGGLKNRGPERSIGGDRIRKANGAEYRIELRGTCEYGRRAPERPQRSWLFSRKGMQMP